jgi:Tol biopolymer transport system component
MSGLMRLPVIPIVVAASLLLAVLYLFNSVDPIRTLDAPLVSRIVDIEGIETEIAIAPDGNRYVVAASGDLWLVDIAGGAIRRILQTPEPESFPSWSPDGERITFTRGGDTFVLDGASLQSEPHVFKQNAAWLSFSPAGGNVFVRDRALWLSDAMGGNETEIVPADTDPDITIRSPRFSPDGVQVAFIKSLLNLQGEVWSVDVVANTLQPLVTDRDIENPLDVGWIMEGKHLVYLTNRAGSYSLWQIDFEQAVNLPLTPPLLGSPLEHIGIGVWKDRIVLPRHFLNADIELSDGTSVIASELSELEPAASPDGRSIAYTVEKDNKYEIWTADITGANPLFRALGREARFLPNGFQLVYTHVDLNGNLDVWKLDLRNGEAERMTDADEMDFGADISHDGRSAAFASARGGPVSVWTVPVGGGKRLRINNGGYFPSYSPDGRSLAFWRSRAAWVMDTNGGNERRVLEGIDRPASAVWTGKGLAAAVGQEIRTADEVLFQATRRIWPRFDVTPDGRFLVSPINIQETSLWAVDLKFKVN